MEQMEHLHAGIWGSYKWGLGFRILGGSSTVGISKMHKVPCQGSIPITEGFGYTTERV